MFKKFNLILMSVFLFACAGAPPQKVFEENKNVNSSNFKFVSYDNEIISAETDTQSYYKIYTDKKYSGSSNVALRSQKKFFVAKLIEDRHLLRVERYIYNEALKTWNMDEAARQPDYLYFDIQKKRLTVVTLEYTKDGAAKKFIITYEPIE